jgi:hemoglobin-like flavoprotein
MSKNEKPPVKSSDDVKKGDITSMSRRSFLRGVAAVASTPKALIDNAPRAVEAVAREIIDPSKTGDLFRAWSYLSKLKQGLLDTYLDINLWDKNNIQSLLNIVDILSSVLECIKNLDDSMRIDQISEKMLTDSQSDYQATPYIKDYFYKLADWIDLDANQNNEKSNNNLAHNLVEYKEQLDDMIANNPIFASMTIKEVRSRIKETLLPIVKNPHNLFLGIDKIDNLDTYQSLLDAAKLVGDEESANLYEIKRDQCMQLFNENSKIKFKRIQDSYAHSNGEVKKEFIFHQGSIEGDYNTYTFYVPDNLTIVEVEKILKDNYGIETRFELEKLENTQILDSEFMSDEKDEANKDGDKGKKKMYKLTINNFSELSEFKEKNKII